VIYAYGGKYTQTAKAYGGNYIGEHRPILTRRTAGGHEVVYNGTLWDELCLWRQVSVSLVDSSYERVLRAGTKFYI